MVRLSANDEPAKGHWHRQLAAAPIVMREYISEMLEDGDQVGATRTLQRLFEHPSSDLNGRRAHRHTVNDPAKIIGHFADDKRLDPHYREPNIPARQRTLQGKKTIVQRLLERLDRRLGLFLSAA